jgi:hypothetical protein
MEIILSIDTQVCKSETTPNCSPRVPDVTRPDGEPETQRLLDNVQILRPQMSVQVQHRAPTPLSTFTFGIAVSSRIRAMHSCHPESTALLRQPIRISGLFPSCRSPLHLVSGEPRNHYVGTRATLFGEPRNRYVGTWATPFGQGKLFLLFIFYDFRNWEVSASLGNAYPEVDCCL